MALSKAETSRLERLLAVIDQFADLDREMPLQMVRVLLIAAMHEGAALAHIAALARLKQSTVSRHALDLGERNRYKQPGHALLDVRPLLEDRRFHIAVMTPNGRAFIQSLISLL